MSLRVAVIWIHIGPYHAARLEALAAKKGVDTVGVQLASSEKIREWRPVSGGTNWVLETLSDSGYGEDNRHFIASRLVERLEEWQPDAVAVAGYAEPAMRRAAKWAKANGRVSIVMSESNRRDRAREVIREWLKGWWIRRYFDAAFVSGDRSAAYLEQLGFPRSRVWRGYSVVDNSQFACGAEMVRQSEAFWREQLGVPKRYFLYVGRLVKEKNVDAVIGAYERYRARQAGDLWDLVLVGDGPEGSRLKEAASIKGIQGVHWPGFKQAEELPRYYALASCFVIASLREPWGLVINEAMASGLPVLVSERCGAASDLVFPGVNGYTFDPVDEDFLSELMLRIASGAVDVPGMGKASREIICCYRPDTWASALGDCIEVSRARKGYAR